MKYLLLSALLLTGAVAYGQGSPLGGVAQPMQAGSLSALDTQNGFHPYVLGAPLRDYPQLKRTGKDLYESTTEPMTMGDVTVTSLNFTGYKGQLASISFGTRGVDNIDKLVSYFTTLYGPTTSANAVMQRWTGTKATLYVTRVGAGASEIGLIMLNSNEIAAKQKAAGK